MFLTRCAIWATSRCNCGWVAQATRQGDTIDVSGAISHRSMQFNAPAPAKMNHAITDSWAVRQRTRVACTAGGLRGSAAPGSRSTNST